MWDLEQQILNLTSEILCEHWKQVFFNATDVLHTLTKSLSKLSLGTAEKTAATD